MPVLKYEELANSLRARIAEGEFGPGDLLPTHRELCEQWGVSRATAVKAYDTLKADGLVTSRQGQGYRVTDTPLARPAGRRHAGSARTSGGRPFRRLGTPDQRVPPPPIADLLGLEGAETALRRARLVLLDDGNPLSLVVAWFPPAIAASCPRLAQPGPIVEGTTRYVARKTGRAPAEGIDVKSVRLATEDEAALLRCETPEAVAVVLHTAYDRAGRILVVEEGVTPSGLWEEVDIYPMGDGS